MGCGQSGIPRPIGKIPAAAQDARTAEPDIHTIEPVDLLSYESGSGYRWLRLVVGGDSREGCMQVAFSRIIAMVGWRFLIGPGQIGSL
jgi:hypothetical protein